MFTVLVTILAITGALTWASIIYILIMLHLTESK
jgi:hypothetical protein